MPIGPNMKCCLTMICGCISVGSMLLEENIDNTRMLIVGSYIVWHKSIAHMPFQLTLFYLSNSFTTFPSSCLAAQ